MRTTSNTNSHEITDLITSAAVVLDPKEEYLRGRVKASLDTRGKVIKAFTRLKKIQRDEVFAILENNFDRKIIEGGSIETKEIFNHLAEMERRLCKDKIDRILGVGSKQAEIIPINKTVNTHTMAA